MKFFKRMKLKRLMRFIETRRAEDEAYLDIDKTVRECLIEIDSKLFDDYTRAQGSRIRFDSIHTNIEGLLSIISDAQTSIIERKPLPQRALIGGEYSKKTNLDRWLETNDRYPVKPADAWLHLTHSLKSLFASIEACDSEAVRVSYTRKLKYVLVDSLISMEALLVTAL